MARLAHMMSTCDNVIVGALYMLHCAISHGLGPSISVCSLCERLSVCCLNVVPRYDKVIIVCLNTFFSAANTHG